MSKSVWISIILTMLLGPLGMFYSTVPGAIIMCIAAVVIGLVTLGFGLPLIWVASTLWGVVAVTQYNAKIANTPNP